MDADPDPTIYRDADPNSDLPQVLNMLENLNFFAFLQRDAGLHCFIIFVSVVVDVILAVFFDSIWYRTEIF